MIESFFMPIQIDSNAYITLDTVFKGRHIITSLGIGNIQQGEAFLTPTGQQTLDAFTAYTSANRPQTALIFWAIADAERTTNRLIKGLNTALAHPESAMFFVCQDSLIYDAVYAALHVRHSNNSIQ